MNTSKMAFLIEKRFIKINYIFQKFQVFLSNKL